MNKNDEIKLLKQKIKDMEEKQFTNKEQQLIKIAKLFGEEAFYEETYKYPVGEKKSYQKLHSFYEAMGRMGKDHLFELKKKILEKFANCEDTNGREDDE